MSIPRRRLRPGLNGVASGILDHHLERPSAGLEAVQHPEVAIWTYRYFGRPYVGFLAPSHVRFVPLPLPYIYVAYDPQYGTVTTGYQASGYGAVFDSHCLDLVRHR